MNLEHDHQLPVEKLASHMFPHIRRHAPSCAFHSGLLSRLDDLTQTAQMILLNDADLQRSAESTKAPHDQPRKDLICLRYEPDILAAQPDRMKHLANWVLTLASEELKPLPGTGVLSEILDRVSAADAVIQGEISVPLDEIVDTGLQPDRALMQKETRQLLRSALAEVVPAGAEMERATLAAREVRTSAPEARAAEAECYADLVDLPAETITHEANRQDAMKPAAVRQRVHRARKAWLDRLVAPVAAAACLAIGVVFGFSASHVNPVNDSGQTFLSPANADELTLSTDASGQTFAGARSDWSGAPVDSSGQT